jgi:hypothetical protein
LRFLKRWPLASVMVTSCFLMLRSPSHSYQAIEGLVFALQEGISQLLAHTVGSPRRNVKKKKSLFCA